jgi:hypothetical protein
MQELISAANVAGLFNNRVFGQGRSTNGQRSSCSRFTGLAKKTLLQVGLGELFAKLEPIVKAYAREYTRKPADVSRRLNAEGHRTAAGAAWTPRLARFLLALMVNYFPKTLEKPGPETESPPRQGPAAPKPIAMDDKDELARRLSSLGRVAMKPKR